MDQIAITPDLDIRRSDLMLTVDFSRPFVLRDILRAAISSSDIYVEEMGELVRCVFLEEFWEEADRNPFEPLTEISVSHLLMTYTVETFVMDDGTRMHSSFWDFGGCRKTDGEEFNLNMIPTFHLSDLPIKVNPKMEWHTFFKRDVQSKVLDFYHPMTLLELMHTVYWHLSLFGPPSRRAEMIDEFVEAVKKLCSNKGAPATVAAVKRTLTEKQ